MDREALFNDNLKWAEGIARNVARKLPSGFDVKDLEQEARIEHWKRCQTYDGSTGVPYQGYAFMAVRGAVLMICRRRNWDEAMHGEVSDNQLDERPLPDAVAIAAQEESNAAARRTAAIERAVAKLPEHAAYWLNQYLNRVSAAVLAKAWGVSETVIKHRFHSASRKLKSAARG